MFFGILNMLFNLVHHLISHSIPLTVEWSVTSPHDYLLAGCHDGTV